jgi:hypothetical protein
VTGEFDLIFRTTPLTPAAQKSASTPPARSAFEQLSARSGDPMMSVSREPEQADNDSPARTDAEHAARMWMTALKIFAPLFDAVITRPIDEFDHKDLMIQFHRLLQATNSISGRVVETIRSTGAINVSDPAHQWVLRQIVPLVADSVAKQWSTHDIVNDDTLFALYQSIIHGIHSGELQLNTTNLQVEGALLEACTVDDRFIRIPARQAIALSQMAAMEPMISSVSNFACWMQPDKLIHALTNIVNENAEFLYGQQPEELMGERGRLVLLQASIKHAGRQTLSAFTSAAQSVLARIEVMDEPARQALQSDFGAGGREAQRLLMRIAGDVRIRCSLLNQAAYAGKQALDRLLNRIDPGTQSPPNRGRL